MYNIDIVFWPHTQNKNVASFRLRCLNIINSFKHGKLIVALYEQQHIPKLIILSKRYDKATVLEAVKLRKLYGTKIVLDICDNHFFNEMKDKQWQLKIDDLIYAVNTVDLIIASTETLSHKIKEHLEKNTSIQIIGDTVEKVENINNYFSLKYWISYINYMFLVQKLKSFKKENRFIWFGSHGSPYASGGIEDLKMIVEELSLINKNEKLCLTIFSNNKKKYIKLFSNLSFEVQYLDWNIYFFSRVLKLHNISVIPININPFTECKTNNRVATSIEHGLAVCATCIPSYLGIIDCISNKSKWQNTLYKYMDSESKNKQVVKALKEIKNNYSEKNIYHKWKTVFEELLK